MDCEGHFKTFSLAVFEVAHCEFWGVEDYYPVVEDILVSSSAFFPDGIILASRICRYLTELILHSTGEMIPMPLAATQAQTITRCLLFMKFCTIFSPFKHTFVIPWGQRVVFFGPSVHWTCFQNAPGLFRCSYALNFSRWLQWWESRNAFLLIALLWRSYLSSCTAGQHIITLESTKFPWRSFAVKRGFWFAFQAIL